MVDWSMGYLHVRTKTLSKTHMGCLDCPLVATLESWYNEVGQLVRYVRTWS